MTIMKDPKGRPVFIEVTELRAIKADGQNWMVMRRSKLRDKETGKPTGGYGDWTSYKYPSSLGAAAQILEEEFIGESGATTFPELARVATQIHAQLKEIFNLAEAYKPQGGLK